MWNHRIVRHTENRTQKDRIVDYAIHEVHYDENGDVSNIDETEIIRSNTLVDLEILLQRLTESFDNPIIDYNTGEED
jgi:hypothetical protein